jgi:hypothetical protein
MRLVVGAVGIEIASLLSKSNKENGVVPPPYSNWSLLEPSTLKIGILSDLHNIELDGCN